MKPSAATVATSSPQITPFLWFPEKAEEAAKFYCSLFPDSKVTSASPLTVTFTLNGREFMALNGGPHYALTPAFSMFISCKDQQEVDRLWDALLAGGGKPTQCGWLVDRFGLSWQVIPKRLMELTQHADAGTRQRAFEAMMQMVKIDVAALEQAVAKAK
jgi:predicted 3-demethylubiquinone-9 3-methyltransferase (glyoxalase superfamily)